MSNLYVKPSGRPTDATLTDAMRDDASSRASTTEVIEIHKRFLRPDPNQPRKHFDQEVLDRRQKQLEEDGQKSPITVFPGVAGEDGHIYYDIEDGECRWRAVMQSDKINYLRAEIDTETDRNDRATIRVNQLLHNDDGAEPLTPLERAYAYKQIVEDLEAQGVESPRGTAAKKLGLSQSVFSEVLSLANLPEDLGEFALEKGITDSKTLNGMVQVYKRGSSEDVELLRRRITTTLEEGGKLRPAVKEVVDKVKARKKKPQAGKAKKEKPSRLLTAKDVKVTLKDDGTGIMTLETPRELLRFNISKEQLEAIRAN